MTVEYVLLLSLFVFLVMGSLVSGPQKSFDNAAPKLGARVEKHLITGDGFGSSKGNGVTPIQWK
jgi:hypothetical protein